MKFFQVTILFALAFSQALSANIAELATEAGLTTLVDLVVKAGLADAVTDPNAQLTVFAPTNEAFAALGQETLNALGNDVDLLKSILLYHVAPGIAKSTDLKNDGLVGTLNGAELRTNIYRSHSGATVTVNGKKVIKADVPASNGIVHVIDEVIQPIPTGNIAAVASGDPNFSTLVDLVVKAGLAETLSDENAAFTVFAPTNEAFAKLPAATVNALVADKEALKKVLLRHVVPGTIYAAGIGQKHTNVDSAGGEKLCINVMRGNVFVGSMSGQAQVVKTDIPATNGVIHVINRVI